MSVSVGNTQEATWIAPTSANGQVGDVWLAGAPESQLAFRIPIRRDTPYLGDADLGQITLSPGLDQTRGVVVQMEAQGRTAFGEKLRFTLEPE